VNTTHLIFIAIFLLLSLADLRYRVVPGIEFVFLGAVFIAAPSNPWTVLAVVLAVAWGWLPVYRFSSRRIWPNIIVLPLLFYPGAWPVLLIGSGVRLGMVGRGDLLAAGSLALVFPWPASVFSLIGLAIWRRWWVKRKGKMRIPGYYSSVPALPGLLMGICLYIGITIFN
jgi:hypothetical protein